VEGVIVNPLEQEYLDNVRRSKNREFWRGVVLHCTWMGILAVTVVAATVVQAADEGLPTLQQLARAALELGRDVVLPGAVLGAICLVAYAYRRHRDRNVVSTTTERERSYRAPAPPANATISTRPDWRRVAYIAALVVLAIAYGTVRTGFGDFLGYGGKAILSVAVVGLAGTVLGVKKLYAAWRIRHNARLEVQWDRFLDSADAGEVGPRQRP
jgi:hypothetical protein